MRKCRLLTLLFAILLIAAGGGLYVMRISSVRDVKAYWSMASEFDGPWVYFAFRIINQGDSVESFLKEHAPTGSMPSGQLVYHRYGEALSDRVLVVAENHGQAAGAAYYDGNVMFVFFGDDTMAPLLRKGTSN